MAVIGTRKRRPVEELEAKQPSAKEAARRYPETPDILVGFDPEAFVCASEDFKEWQRKRGDGPLRSFGSSSLIGKDGEYLGPKVSPGHMFSMGMKGFYEISEDCEPNIGLLADGMAVEINTTRPARGADDLVLLKQAAQHSLERHVMNRGGQVLSASSIEVFPEFRADPAFLEIGCEPDYCVYERKMVPPINPLGSHFRHAGGHFHISAPKVKAELDPHDMAKALDIMLGAWACSYKNPRRAVIGAGRIRIKDKNYIEYRTPDNSWLFSTDEKMDLMFWSMRDAIALAKALKEGSISLKRDEFERMAATAQALINEGIQKGSSAITAFYHTVHEHNLMARGTIDRLYNHGIISNIDN